MQSCVFRQGGVAVVVVVNITNSIIIIIIIIIITSLELLRQALKLYFNNVRLKLNFYAISHIVNSMGWSGLDWIHLVHGSDKWRAVVNTVMKLSEFHTMQGTVNKLLSYSSTQFVLLKRRCYAR
jgi:hypothetical protein